MPPSFYVGARRAARCARALRAPRWTPPNRWPPCLLPQTLPRNPLPAAAAANKPSPRSIVDDTFAIRYPPYLSPAAKELIARLLERRPARRLGMLSGRANDIKRHRWFEGFDWDALEAKRLPPPRKPKEADVSKRLRDLTEAERASRRTRESVEDLQESEAIFAEF